jgi:hypothetical protein
MIFTFWTSGVGNADPEAVPSAVDAALKDWSSAFPEFRLFGERDIAPLLQRRGDEYLRIFNRIRIPACRSDVARLLLLHEHGGLYIDAHVGSGNFTTLAGVLEKLSGFELILFDKTWEHKHPNDIYVVNTFMCARRRSGVVEMLLDGALENLMNHHTAEIATSAYVPYNIYTLTGAWDIGNRILDRRAVPIAMKREFADKVHIEPLERGHRLPFRPYTHYGYREPGLHWSERQKTERLFLE